MSNSFLAQAEMNRAINTAWLEVLAARPIADLEQDQGAFFGSIFATLNHILLGDRIWLGRIGGAPFVFDKLSDRLCETLEQFTEERAHTDADLIALCKAGEFERMIAYHNSAGTQFSQPLHTILMHLFAHQHHHRGQISQMCHEQSIPIPDGGTIAYTR